MTRRVGKAIMFKLNDSNNVVVKLKEMYLETTKMNVENKKLN